MTMDILCKSEVLEVLENQNQLGDKKENETIIEYTIDNAVNKVDTDSSYNATISYTLSNYQYTKEDIEKFFVSYAGQEDDHTLEESICRPLIGKHTYKPFFRYCKEDPAVEFLSSKSMEDHIILKDPEGHKAKLLELIQEKKPDVVKTRTGDQDTN
jgi:hypothetical protein